MAAKYYCRRCEKKYVQWGAEKLKFLCPHCDGEELVRVAGPDGASGKAPSLKRAPRKRTPRKPKRKPKEVAVVDEVEVPEPDKLKPGAEVVTNDLDSTADEDLELSAELPLDEDAVSPEDGA